jgi:hypothetical protein
LLQSAVVPLITSKEPVGPVKFNSTVIPPTSPTLSTDRLTS